MSRVASLLLLLFLAVTVVEGGVISHPVISTEGDIAVLGDAEAEGPIRINSDNGEGSALKGGVTAQSEVIADGDITVTDEATISGSAIFSGDLETGDLAVHTGIAGGSAVNDFNITTSDITGSDIKFEGGNGTPRGEVSFDAPKGTVNVGFRKTEPELATDIIFQGNNTDVHGPVDFKEHLLIKGNTTAKDIHADVLTADYISATEADFFTGSADHVDVRGDATVFGEVIANTLDSSSVRAAISIDTTTGNVENLFVETLSTTDHFEVDDGSLADVTVDQTTEVGGVFTVEGSSSFGGDELVIGAVDAPVLVQHVGEGPAQLIFLGQDQPDKEGGDFNLRGGSNPDGDAGDLLFNARDGTLNLGPSVLDIEIDAPACFDDLEADNVELCHDSLTLIATEVNDGTFIFGPENGDGSLTFAGQNGYRGGDFAINVQNDATFVDAVQASAVDKFLVDSSFDTGCFSGSDASADGITAGPTETDRLWVGGATNLQTEEIFNSAGSEFVFARPESSTDASATSFFGASTSNGNGGSIAMNTVTADAGIGDGPGGSSGVVFVGTESGNVEFGSTHVAGVATVETQLESPTVAFTEEFGSINQAPREEAGDGFNMKFHSASDVNVNAEANIAQQSGLVYLDASTSVSGGSLNLEQDATFGATVIESAALDFGGDLLTLGEASESYKVQVAGAHSIAVSGTAKFNAGNAAQSGEGGDVKFSGSEVTITALNQAYNGGGDGLVEIGASADSVTFDSLTVRGDFQADHAAVLADVTAESFSGKSDLFVTPTSGPADQEALVADEVNASGKVSADSLESGATQFGGNLRAGSLQAANLEVGGNAEIAYESHVGLEAWFGGDLKVLDKTTVGGELKVGGDLSSETLAVSGQTNVNDGMVIEDCLDVTTTADFDKDLTAEEVTVTETDISSRVDFEATQAVDTTVSQLNVHENVHAHTLASANTLVVKGDLGAHQASVGSALASDLSVPVASVGSVVTTDLTDISEFGSLDAGQSLVVSGAARFTEVTAASVHSLGNSQIGHLSARSTTAASLVADSVTGTGAAVFGAAISAKDVEIESTLNAASLSVNDDLDVDGDVFSGTTVTVGEDLTVGGDFSAASLSVETNSHIYGDVEGPSAVNVLGTVHFDGDLYATDPSDFGQLDVRALATVNDLTVNNAFVVDGDFVVGDGLDAAGDGTISGDVCVREDAVVDASLAISNNGHFGGQTLEVGNVDNDFAIRRPDSTGFGRNTFITGQEGANHGGEITLWGRDHALDGNGGSVNLLGAQGGFESEGGDIYIESGFSVLEDGGDIVMSGGGSEGNTGGSLNVNAGQSQFANEGEIRIGTSTAAYVAFAKAGVTTTIHSNLDVAGDFESTADTTATGDVTVSGNLHVNGATNTEQLIAGNTVVGGDLDVESAAGISTAANTITIAGDLTTPVSELGNVVAVSGDVAGDVNIDDAAQFDGDIYFGDNLNIETDIFVDHEVHVGENADFDRALNVAGSALLNSLTVADEFLVEDEAAPFIVGRNVDVTNTLTVQSNSVVGGTLAAASLDSQDVNVGKNMWVQGTATTGDVAVTDLNARVTNNAVFSGSVNVEHDTKVGIELIATASELSIEQDLTVQESAYLTSLDVTGSSTAHQWTALNSAEIESGVVRGDATAGNLVNVAQNANVDHDITVAADTTVRNTLTAGGSSLVGGNTQADVVNANEHMLANQSLATSGHLSIAFDMNVARSTTAQQVIATDTFTANVNNNGDVTTSGDLTFAMNAEFNELSSQTLEVDSLLKTGSLTVGSDLNAYNLVVRAIGAIDGNLDVGDNIVVGDNVVLSGAFSGSSLLVKGDTTADVSLSTFADAAISGESTVGSLTVANNFDVSNNVQVDSLFSVGTHLDAGGLVVSGQTDVTNAVNVNSDATFKDTLSVGGFSSFGCDGVVSEGPVTVSGAVTISDSLAVNDNAQVTGRVSVAGDAYLNDLFVAGDSTLASAFVDGKLTVTGDAQFALGVDVSGDVFADTFGVDGELSAEDLFATGSFTVDTINVGRNGNFVGDGSVSGTLDVAQRVHFEQSVTANDLTVIDRAFLGDLTVGADSTVSEDVLVLGNGEVGGSVFAEGDALALHLDTETLTVDDLTVDGHSRIKTLTVDEAAAFHADVNVGKDLAVSFSTSIKNDLFVERNVDAGDLTVSGSTYLNTLEVIGTTTTQQINIEGALDSSADGEFTLDVNVGGTASAVTGSVKANADVGILSAALGADFDADYSGENGAVIGGDLEVGAETAVDHGVYIADNLAINADLNVQQSAKLADLSVSTDSVIAGNVNVLGDIHIDDTANIAGKVVSGSFVTGPALVNNNVDVNENAYIGTVLQVVTADLGGDVQVNGAADVVGRASISNDLIVDVDATVGELSVLGSTTLQDATTQDWTGQSLTIEKQATLLTVGGAALQSGSLEAGAVVSPVAFVKGDFHARDTFHATGAVSFEEASKVDETVTSPLTNIGNDLQIGLDANADTLNVQGTAYLQDFTVDGDITANAIKLSENLSVDGSTTTTSLKVGKGLYGETATVSVSSTVGALTAGNAQLDDVTVTGDAAFAGLLDSVTTTVDSSSKVHDDVSSASVTVSDATKLESARFGAAFESFDDATIDGNFVVSSGVTSATVSSGSLHAGTVEPSDVRVAGNTKVEGTLIVGDSARFGCEGVVVEGEALVGDDLISDTDITVHQDMFLDGALSVGGLALLNDVVAEQTTVNEDFTTSYLHVSGDATVDDDAIIAGHLQTGLLDVSGTTTSESVYVHDDASLSGDLTVTEGGHVDQSVFVDGQYEAKDLRIDESLTVDNNVVGNDLHVKGSTYLVSATSANVWVGQDLTASVGVDASTAVTGGTFKTTSFTASDVVTNFIDVESDATIETSLQVGPGITNVHGNVNAGATTAAGDVLVGGHLSTASLTAQNDLHVGSSVFVDSSIVREDAKVGGLYSVGSDMNTLNSDVSGNLGSGDFVTGKLSAKDISVSGLTAITGSLDVEDSADFDCEFGVTAAENFMASDVTVGSDATFEGAATVNRDLRVAGSSFFGDLEVADIHFENLAADSLNVAAEGNFAGDLDVTNAISDPVTISVDGTTRAGAFESGDLTVGGTTAVSGSATLQDVSATARFGTSGVKGTTSVATDINAATLVAGSGHSRDTLDANDVDLSGWLRVIGNVDLTSDFTVDGHYKSGSVTTGATTVQSASVGTAALESTLSVDGATTFGCDAPVTVTGELTADDAHFAEQLSGTDLVGERDLLVKENLFATQLTVSDLLKVGGNADVGTTVVNSAWVGNNLVADVQTDVAQTVWIETVSTTDSLVVDVAQDIGGDLRVGGLATYQTNLSVTDDFTVQHNGQFGETVVDGALFVLKNSDLGDTTATDWKSTANVAANEAAIHGDSHVTGKSTTGNVDTGDVSATGMAAGTALLQSDLTVDGEGSFGCDADLTVANDTTVAATSWFHDSLSVAGNAVVGESTTVSGFSTFGANFVSSAGLVTGDVATPADLLAQNVDATFGAVLAGTTATDTFETEKAYIEDLHVLGDVNTAIEGGDLYVTCEETTLNTLQARSVSVGENAVVANVTTASAKFGSDLHATSLSTGTLYVHKNAHGATSVEAEDVWFGRNFKSAAADFGPLSVRTDAAVDAALTVSGNTEVAGTLSVLEASLFSSDVSVFDCFTFEVTGDADLTTALNVGGDMHVAANADLTGELDMAGSLNVHENAQVDGSLSVAGNGHLHDNVKVAGNTWVGGSYDVPGDALFRGAINTGTNFGNSSFETLGYLTVGGDVFINDEIDVAGDTSLKSDLWADETLLNGKLVVDNTAWIGGELDVWGFVSVGDDLDVENNMFVGGELCVVHNSNVGINLDIDENLGVEEDVHLDDTLDIGNDLSVGRKAKVHGNLNVTGDLEINSELSVVDLTTIEGWATVADKSYFSENLEGQSDMDVGTSMHVKGDATFDDSFTASNAVLNNSLNVGGDFVVTGTLKTDESASVHGYVIVNHDVDTMDLDVALDSFVASIDANQANIDGMLVADASTLAELTTVSLTVDGSLTSTDGEVWGNADIVGDVTSVSNISVSGNTNVNADFSTEFLTVVGDLDVATTTDISQTLNVGGDLSVATELLIDGNLQVWGDEHIDGTVESSADFVIDEFTSLKDNLLVQTDVSIGGELIVQEFVSVVDTTTVTNHVDVGENIEATDLIVGGDATVGGDFDNGDFFANDTLDVKQSVTVDGNLDVSGDVSLLDSVGITGLFSVSGWADVECDVETNSLTIGENLYAQSDLSVTGDYTTDDVAVAGDACINEDSDVIDANLNTLDVDGRFDVGGDLDVNDVHIKGMLTVQNVTTMVGELFVLGSVSIDDSLDIKESVSIGGELIVEGTANLADNIFIDDNVWAGPASIVNVTNDLIVSTDVGVEDLTTIGAGLIVENDGEFCNDTVVEGNLDIDGELQINNAKVNGDLVICGPVTIVNDFILNDTAVVEGNFETQGFIVDNGRVDLTCGPLGFPYNGAEEVAVNIGGNHYRTPKPTTEYEEVVVRFAPTEDLNQFYSIALTGCTLNILEPYKMDVSIARLETIAFDQGTEIYRYEVGDIILVKGASHPLKMIHIYDYEDCLSEVGPSNDCNVYNGRTLFTENSNSFVVHLNSDEIVVYMYSPRVNIGADADSGTVVFQNSPVEWTRVA